MREIKFRGLRTDGKGWVYGLPIKSDEKIKLDGQDYSDCYISEVISDDFIECAFNGSYMLLNVDAYMVKPESVGQYTGLKDKNGVEIYDGDVIKGKSDLGGRLRRFIGVVDVNLPSVSVKGVKQYHWKTCRSIFDVTCFEVIGNIYENHELLEGAE